jgi:alpha,alpha-trehalose phosphorylase
VRDSSLSASIQAIVAAETGHLELAYDYLAEAVFMDLRDLEHNTRDGLHLAALAGSWIALVAGFGGLRDHDGLCFSPRLPEELSRICFCLTVRGGRLRVEITGEAASYSRLEGDPLPLSHHGEAFVVSAGAPVVRKVPVLVPRPRPPQPPGRDPGAGGRLVE